MKLYIITKQDKKLSCTSYYWGSKSGNMHGFINDKAWAVKLTYNQALKIARMRKEYQIQPAEILVDEKILPKVGHCDIEITENYYK